jgi:predicted DsbA family dithiol-disulfide isomerase
LRQNYEIAIQWRAFPLHPEIPEEGLSLKELFAGRRVDVKAMMLRLQTVADELDLPLGAREMTFNSRLAQELAKWAETRGRGDEFHEAVFRAYFVEGRNIGKMEQLVELAKSVGLAEQEAKTVLRLRSFRQAVDSDWSRARALGISAVPTFVFGNQAVVGAQSYEVLEQFLKEKGARRRKVGPAAFDS